MPRNMPEATKVPRSRELRYDPTSDMYQGVKFFAQVFEPMEEGDGYLLTIRNDRPYRGRGHDPATATRRYDGLTNARLALQNLPNPFRFYLDGHGQRWVKAAWNAS